MTRLPKSSHVHETRHVEHALRGRTNLPSSATPSFKIYTGRASLQTPPCICAGRGQAFGLTRRSTASRSKSTFSRASSPLMCRAVLDVALLRTRSALDQEILLSRDGSAFRTHTCSAEEAERLAATVSRPSLLFGRSLADKWREDACECLRHLSRSAEFAACEIVENLAISGDDGKVALRAACRAIQLASFHDGASLDIPGMQRLRRRSLVHSKLCGVDVSAADVSAAAFGRHLRDSR